MKDKELEEEMVGFLRRLYSKVEGYGQFLMGKIGHRYLETPVIFDHEFMVIFSCIPFLISTAYFFLSLISPFTPQILGG